ncbi:MAG: transcription elongation factor GreA [Chloroflexota bacterium]|nr:transcription elongation factor GreA [Euryarchaeota archaeon]MEA2007532.1 transcription elongation factor GreA [Chloroflexota bacterium]
MAPTYLTQEGHEKLKRELNFLKTRKRQEVAERMKEALDGGPLGVDADAEVEAARNASAFVEGRIHYLQGILSDVELVQTVSEADVVQMGTTVTIEYNDGEVEIYTIVGKVEADPLEGRVSNVSPIGSSLLGCSEGDEVDILAPAGVFSVKILKIG